MGDSEKNTAPNNRSWWQYRYAADKLHRINISYRSKIQCKPWKIDNFGFKLFSWQWIINTVLSMDGHTVRTLTVRSSRRSSVYWMRISLTSIWSSFSRVCCCCTTDRSSRTQLWSYTHSLITHEAEFAKGGIRDLVRAPGWRGITWRYTDGRGGLPSCGPSDCD